MEIAAHISLHRTHSEQKVLLMRVFRYLQTAYLLHLMAVGSGILVFLLGKLLLMHWNNDASFWKLLLHAYLCLYFCTLVLFSQFDARSRYQNYKMAKDKLYHYGFDVRLLRPFAYSRCQRDAIAVAVRELNMTGAWKQFTHVSGYRWYHLLPDMVVKRPGILFTRDYWIKTLFVKTYHSNYFLW